MLKKILFLFIALIFFNNAFGQIGITATPTLTATDVPTEVAVNYATNSQAVTFQQAVNLTAGNSYNMSRGPFYGCSVNFGNYGAPNFAQAVTLDLEYSLDGVNWTSIGNSGAITAATQFQCATPVVGHFVRTSWLGVSPTPTFTPANTYTPTPTLTPTVLTSTPTNTSTNTYTMTSTNTPTNTLTFTNTNTPTTTWSNTVKAGTNTWTPTPTPSFTTAYTSTPTCTFTNTLTLTSTCTFTNTLTMTKTYTVTPSFTPTWTPPPQLGNVKIKVN